MMKSIGVLGAYGHVGTAVVRELARFSGHRLVLGGRDRGKLERLAGELAAECSLHAVDVEDRRSVAAFCEGCDVVVNGSRYTDAFAEAVFEAGRDLVDATAFRVDRWRGRHDELAARGTRWILYTGWIPGLPEVVAAYLEAIAARRFGRVAAVEVYVYDCNEYRGRGLLELVGGFFYGPGVLNAVDALLRRERPRRPPATDEHMRMRSFPAVRLAELPPPAGRQLVVSMGHDPRRKVFLAFDPRLLPAMFASFWYGTTRGEDWLAEHVVGPVFRRRVARRGHAEVLRARATGERGERLAVDYVETRRDGYWLSGVVPATAARLVCAGRIDRPGLMTLDQAMDPVVLADELAAVGIDFRVRS